MKGSTDEATRTALTLVLGIFVVYSIYLFGTEIFKAGARINVSSSSTGVQCACIGTTGYKIIECSGKTIECSACDADNSGYCKTTQKLSLENLSSSPGPIQNLRVCVSMFYPGGGAGATNVYIDGELLGSISGNCDISTAACCKDFSFSEPRRIKEVTGEASTNWGLWRFEAYWQTKSLTS